MNFEFVTELEFIKNKRFYLKHIKQLIQHKELFNRHAFLPIRKGQVSSIY
jgi:hypothetical protein